jgi:hypothetical protein
MAEFKNEFSWSTSRDALFEECKRKYYYNYYGSWGGWERGKADDVTRTLYVLKQLKSRWQWKGTIVHNEIARILKQLVSTGKLTPIEASLSRVTDLMREEFRYSRDGSYWEKDGGLRDVTSLFEHEYKVSIPDEDWKKIHEEVIGCIRNFYKSDVLEKVRNLDKKAILSIDSITPTLFSFNDEKIYVNLDLAYRIENKIEIVDWKTGVGESEPLQFVVYTIYAKEVLGIPLEKISVIEYNLLTEQKIVHKFSPDNIKEAKEHINKSIASMKSCLRNPLENTAVMTDFSRTEDERKCEFCNFKKICFDLP